MSRAVTAALFLALFALPVSAQMRGGGHSLGGSRGGHSMGGMRGGHAFGGVRSSGVRSFHGPSVSFRAHSGFGFSHGPRVFVRPHGFFPRTHFRTFHRRPFITFGYYSAYGYGYGYPYYSYPAYDSLYYSTPVYDSSVADRSYQQYQQLSNDVNDLSSEVRDLRDQNEQLRYDLERRRYPEAQPLSKSPRAIPKPVAETPFAVLVFRDGHRTEVANYAIVGQTLWILSDQRARKVPLTELNLEESKRQNAERGIDFSFPTAK